MPFAAPAPCRPPVAPLRVGRRASSGVSLGVSLGIAASLALLGLTATAAAQSAPPVRDSAARADSAARLDSLAARLERAEAALALLRQEMAAESETAVRTRSRLSLELSARVLVNGFFTSRATNGADVPLVVRAGSGGGSLGISARQTRVGAALTVRDVAGGIFDGDVDADFFGGSYDSTGAIPSTPLLRLRTARGWLRWKRTAVMAGVDTPLISDLNPLSTAAVGLPLFSGAGNLWTWLPQVRVSRELLGTRLRWAVQGAVLEPSAGAGSGNGYGTQSTVDAGERSRRPALEGRLRARWGREDDDAPPNADVRDAPVGEGPSEIGVGVHRGWVAGPPGVTYASRAVAIDARVVLAPRVELRGEAYRGTLVAGLGGGAIAQGFGQPGVTGGGYVYAVARPLTDGAGWAQLDVRPTEFVVAGAGCGVDVVRTAERPVRQRNTACAAHIEWRPVQPLLLGLEYRRTVTGYQSGSFGADHVNLALGFEI